MELEPGEGEKVVLNADQRLIGEWEDGRWHMPAGTYRFGMGTDAETITAIRDVRLAAKSWSDR